MKNPIYEITGGEHTEKWIMLDPLVFHSNNGSPHGLIKASPFRLGLLIASCTKDNKPHNKNMIRYIRELGMQGIVLYIEHDVDTQYIHDALVKSYGKRFRIKKLLTDNFFLTICKRR